MEDWQNIPQHEIFSTQESRGLDEPEGINDTPDNFEVENPQSPNGQIAEATTADLIKSYIAEIARLRDIIFFI